MCWNRRERTIGEAAFAAVFVAGLAATPWAVGAWVRPGTSEAAVEAVLGPSRGLDPQKPWYKPMCLHRPMADEEFARFQEQSREDLRRNGRWSFIYACPGREFTVTYHAPHDERRVLEVEDRPGPWWVFGPYLVWCAAGGIVFGLAAAELARRRRSAPPAPVAT